MFDNAPSLPPRLFTEDGARLGWRAYALLLLLCLAFFLPGIATLPPTDRDESLFAQSSKQMIESGNYIDIHFQDQARYKKPVGIYWLQALSASLFTPHHLNQIWAYRVPSMIGATLTVLMTAALGALLFGPTAGFLAAIMLAGCAILNVDARLAKTDSMLLGMTMIAQYGLARAYLARAGAKPGWGVWLVFWTALSAGCLLKGPVILLIVLSTLLWLRIADKNISWFSSLRPRFGIPYFLFLVAPWFISIAAASHGVFFQQSAGQDMLAKIWQGQNHHAFLPGVHLLVFPLMAFPFSLWALLAVPDAWRERHTAAVKFCLGWIVPVWIVFELSLTKLPHYTMPTYPALAILAARGLCEGFPALAGRWRWLPPLATGLWLVVGTGLAMAVALIPYELDHAWNGGQIAAGLLLIIAQGASLFLLMRRRENAPLVMAAGMLVFVIAAFAATLPRLQHLWLSRDALEIAESVKPCARVQIVSTGYNEPSLAFLAGTDTKMMTGGAIGAVWEMQKAPCSVGIVSTEDEQDFLSHFPDPAHRPLPVGAVEGYNLGRGAMMKLKLYRMPPQDIPQ